jgi:hypothetical protein
MKKLFVILAAVALVWAFAVPASAVDWNFYGSARMATYWTSSETGSGSTKTEESELDWGWQNNSRIGARVKGETLSGNFELALKVGNDGATHTDVDDGNSGGGDGDVGTRRLEANWDFGAGTLSVGKGYTSFNQFLSGQVVRGDAGLLGEGFMYAGRPAYIGLTFGGFGVQFIEPRSNHISGTAATDGDFLTDPLAPATALAPGVASNNTSSNGDVDQILPKIEANWGMAFDAFSFQLRGGWQYYCIKDVISSVDGSKEDVGVNSYGLGAEGSFNFGPAYVRAGLSLAKNGGNAGWTAGSGTWDGDDDVDDTDTVQGAIVVGFKMSDMVSFEGGFGYRNDDFDTNVDDTDMWAAYVQSVIGLAPGVFLIPEFGYRDVDPEGSASDSTDWYLGAKWQMDF